MNEHHSYQNQFLIAMPKLDDINFSRAVIFIEEHNEEGAIGLVVNKPLHLNIGNMMEHLNITVSSDNIREQPVFMGGPLGQDQGFVLHKPWQAEHTSSTGNANNDIVISASKEILRLIATNKGPPEYLIALGYSGWEPGQLEQEIQQNEWLTAPCSPHILFDTPTEQRWKASARLLGINIDQLSDQTGHA